MKYTLLCATAILGTAAFTAFADDPPQPPRTHVDATVVGSSSPADSGVPAESATLDSDHHFEAGAPDLVKITRKLNLSSQQQAQVDDAIERADAGAAVLIKRERAVKEMIAATTPQDPLYAKLITEQSTAPSRWSENRDGLRRDVIAILTPDQRTRFQELEASR
jgi:Spy/CpxP family protein refolding chaperone